MAQTAQLVFPSPLGPVVVRAEAGAIVRIQLDVDLANDTEGDRPRDDDACATDRDSTIEQALCRRAREQLDAYFTGDRQSFDLPLSPTGTAFQQAVWRVMCDIPYGDTLSYGEVAHALDNPGASRAVGLACGANPIPVVIPCHRITGSGGSLGGFGYGPAFKRWLLDLEHYGRPPLGSGI